MAPKRNLDSRGLLSRVYTKLEGSSKCVPQNQPSQGSFQWRVGFLFLSPQQAWEETQKEARPDPSLEDPVDVLSDAVPKSRGSREGSLSSRRPKKTFWVKRTPLEVIDRILAS